MKVPPRVALVGWLPGVVNVDKSEQAGKDGMVLQRSVAVRHRLNQNRGAAVLPPHRCSAQWRKHTTFHHAHGLACKWKGKPSRLLVSLTNEHVFVSVVCGRRRAKRYTFAPAALPDSHLFPCGMTKYRALNSCSCRKETTFYTPNPSMVVLTMPPSPALASLAQRLKKTTVSVAAR